MTRLADEVCLKVVFENPGIKPRRIKNMKIFPAPSSPTHILKLRLCIF
jgi:hypothetical protein